MPTDRNKRDRGRTRPTAAMTVLAALLALWPAAAAALTGSAVSSADTLDSRPPVVDVVYPLGGETFTGAETETLRWTIDEQSWAGGAPITLRMFDGNVLLDEQAVAPEPGGVYAYPWTVADVSTTQARFKVTADDRFGWADADSGDVFTIVEAGTSTPGLLVDRVGPVVPNPFNPSTRIHFSLQADADIVLSIYDLRGRSVTRLAAGAWPAGHHDVRWQGLDSDGAAVASGTYFARLSIDGATDDLVTRLTLVR